MNKLGESIFSEKSRGAGRQQLVAQGRRISEFGEEELGSEV